MDVIPTFTPPSRPLSAVLPETTGPARALFRHYTWASGQSVLLLNGVYQTIENPSVDQIAAATEVYLGGHQCPVSSATAAALTAAGYGAYVS